MKIVIVTNNKGGVGKTTVAVHLLWASAERGIKSMLLDMDEEQGGNAVRWCMAHQIRKPDPDRLYQSVWGGDCMYLPSKIPDGYQLYVVDTRPSISQIAQFEDILTHVVMPFRGRFAREGMEDLIQTAKDLRWDVRIPFGAIPNMTEYTVQSRVDIEKAKKLGIHMFSPIRYYPFVDKALEEGRPVWKTPWGSKTLIKQRMEEILKWIGLIR